MILTLSVCPYTQCPVWRYFTKIWTTTMSWIYIKKYSINFDQTLQRHGRGIELSKNIKILVTFDLHSRSRDPRWPPNTFFKVKFGPKTTNNSANFWSNSIILFCFVAGDQFSTLDGKAIPTMVPCVFWLQRNDPPILLFTTMENALSPFSTENDGKIDPNCHSATLDIFAMTYKCF